MWNKSCNTYFIFAAFILLLPGACGANAQTPPVVPPRLPTLASVLVSVPPPAGVLLVVGAESVTLPNDASLPTAPASADDVAQAFGCETHTFGMVTAVAPATMVTLNENPDPPDIMADLSPDTTFKMLVASLNDAQWHALTSEAGLGLTDLTDDTQHGLFHALFRHGQLFVAPEAPDLAKLPAEKRGDIQDLSSQIDSVHVRLGQTSSIYVHDRKGNTVYFHGDNPADAQHLQVYLPKHNAAASHAVTLRAVMPNVPKASQLNLGGSAFQTLVSLANLRTVGSLVLRIGMQTHTELYADPHYASKTLTIIGSAPNAPAADLLRALALCVTGTFRQVGQAFVLTDDLSGVGARRERLSDWEDKARALNSRLRDTAGKNLLAKHGKDARFIPTFGDPMALTPEQIKAEKLDSSIPGLPEGRGNTVPFVQLTPAQQETARRIADDYNAKRISGDLPFYLDKDKALPADLGSPVSLNPDNHVQLLVPSLGGPVETDFGAGGMWFLYYPGEEASIANARQAQFAKPAASQHPALPLGSLLRMGKRRALIAHPRTSADVDALFPVLQKLGLNELWLDVFSNGTARIPGSSLSPSAPFDGPDILTEALKLAKNTKVAVYADMNLLTWGEKPPSALADLNIRGETTQEAALRKHTEAPETRFDDNGNSIPFAAPGTDVSPPAARDTLAALVHTLAVQPGLAGFIWHGATPDDDLGYIPAMRLAFLRARHADPIDVDPARYSRVDLSLPAWDNPSVDSALSAQWTALRTAAVLDMLRRLRQSATTSQGTLPILMEQSTDNINWLASWDDPRGMPPPLRTLFPGNPFPDRARVPPVARAQGRTVLRDIDIQGTDNTGALALRLQSGLPAALWDGYVLDSDNDEATRGSHPLDALLRAVQSPASAP